MASCSPYFLKSEFAVNMCMGSFLGSRFCSTDLYVCFLCQYYIDLITAALQYRLKSGLYFQLCSLFSGLLGNLWFYINFRIICSSTVENIIGVLIVWGSIAILTILILPIQEHGISVQFYESSLVSSINVLVFSI